MPAGTTIGPALGHYVVVRWFPAWAWEWYRGDNLRFMVRAGRLHVEVWKA